MWYSTTNMRVSYIITQSIVRLKHTTWCFNRNTAPEVRLRTRMKCICSNLQHSDCGRCEWTHELSCWRVKCGYNISWLVWWFSNRAIERKHPQVIYFILFYFIIFGHYFLLYQILVGFLYNRHTRELLTNLYPTWRKDALFKVMVPIINALPLSRLRFWITQFLGLYSTWEFGVSIHSMCFIMVWIPIL
jgi:hypothetical protein